MSKNVLVHFFKVQRHEIPTSLFRNPFQVSVDNDFLSRKGNNENTTVGSEEKNFPLTFSDAVAIGASFRRKNMTVHFYLPNLLRSLKLVSHLPVGFTAKTAFNDPLHEKNQRKNKVKYKSLMLPAQKSEYVWGHFKSHNLKRNHSLCKLHKSQEYNFFFIDSRQLSQNCWFLPEEP